MSSIQTNSAFIKGAMIRTRAAEKKPRPAPDDSQLNELKRQALEKDKRIAELCAELQELCGGSDPFAAQRILRAVAIAHGLTVRDLTGPRRHKNLVRARHHAMWEIKQNTGLSLPQIGRLLGGRDHTTVIHGLRQYEARTGSSR